MARIVKEEEYAVRRNEILDAAQRLIYTKGYEQMTVQDILSEMSISKGAFYHYFDSKGALLEALVDRFRAEIEQVLTPIVEDPGLPALEKLNRYFDTAGRWKTAQKDFLLALLRAWYHDDNAIVRQKIFAAMVKWITPVLARIIRQGVQEGIFQTGYPEQTGEVLLSIFEAMGETFADVLLSPETGPDNRRRLHSTAAAYTEALERILGAPKGSLRLIDPEVLDEWLIPTQNHPNSNGGERNGNAG